MPTSLGGSDEDCNLSTLIKARHASFHEDWAENRDPCMLTRLIAIHAVGLHGKTPDPGSLHEILRLTAQSNGATPYKVHAFRHLEKGHRLTRKVLETTSTRVVEELLDTRHAIEALVNGGRLPHKRNPFLHECLRFFGSKSPLAAIAAMHDERHEGELSWVKPLREDVRSRILAVAHGGQMLPLEQVNDDVVGILRGQSCLLTKQFEGLQRELGHFGVNAKRRKRGRFGYRRTNN